jgi:predicted HTH domain antitoxin
MEPEDVHIRVEADLDPETLLAVTASAREAAVLELYRLGRITSGGGARLLGIPRVDFLELAATRRIPTLQVTPEEISAEVTRHR